ncbi:MAG: hypothetical protein QHI38_06025 [Armatimonadota bacterium]|nr:hypothetical protein [Armatimonadota bacterium]
MEKISVPAILLLLGLLSCPAAGYVYVASDFNALPVGSVPQTWTVLYTSGSVRTCAVVDAATELPDSPPDIKKCVKLYDANGDTSNIHFRHWIPRTSEGTTVIQFDVRFSQITANFAVRVTNGDTFTTVANSACQLQFEGSVAWASGASGPGCISYLKTHTASLLAYSGVVYEPNKWYTCRIELTYDALPENRRMTCYFGEKNGTLNKILDAVYWTYKNGAFPTGMVDNLQQVGFMTSNKSEGDQTVYLDNILIEGPVAPLDYATVGQARLAPKGTLLRVTDKIVTAGTDAFGQIFYIQDNISGGAGIRVRTDQTVQEGDVVDVWGSIAQASEGGSSTNHNCEREIVANSVVVKSQGNPVPRPVWMPCKNLGGGWFGPDEVAGGVTEPVLKGVYPFNTWGDTAFDPLTNSFCPLFNVGTLVTIVGRVTQWCGDYPSYYKSNDYYVWDGSDLAETSRQLIKYSDYDGWHVVDNSQVPPVTVIDESNHPSGVRVRIPSWLFPQLPKLNVGDVVAVTGISGAISNSEIVSQQKIRNIRVLRVRKASDVVVIQRVSEE